MRIRSHERSARRGMTLLELALSVSIASVMFGSAALLMRSNYNAYRTATQSSNLETRVRRALDRISRELMLTGRDVIDPDPTGDFGTEDLRIRQATGVTDGEIDWGTLNRIGFEYAEGEIDDGADNNGNGLIDEGQVVLTRNIGAARESRSVLCTGVSEFLEGEVPDGDDDNGNGVTDERGFNIHRSGDVLTIRLSVESIGWDGARMQRTVETGIRLRN